MDISWAVSVETIRALKSVNDRMWIYGQILIALPLLTILVMKYREQKGHVQPPRRVGWANWTIYGMFFYATWYYVSDTLLYLIDGRDWETCRYGSLLHHLVSMTGSPLFLAYTDYPWFVVGPIFMHAMLMAFPLVTWLNYVYLAFVFACHYGLGHKHLQSHPTSLLLRTVAIKGFYLAVVTLWYLDCKNTIQD